MLGRGGSRVQKNAGMRIAPVAQQAAEPTRLGDEVTSRGLVRAAALFPLHSLVLQPLEA